MPGLDCNSAAEKSVEQSHDRDSASPRGPQLPPDVRAFKGPRRYEHNQLVRLLEESQDVLLEVRADVDLSLVKEWSCPTRGDLTRNLLRHTQVSVPLWLTKTKRSRGPLVQVSLSCVHLCLTRRSAAGQQRCCCPVRCMRLLGVTVDLPS